MFINNFDYYVDFNWLGTVITNVQTIKEKGSVQWFRDFRSTLSPAWDAGWHMTYWGSAENIIYKIKSSAHQEYNNPEYANIDKIKENLGNGVDIFGRAKLIPFDITTLDKEIYDIFSKYIKKL